MPKREYYGQIQKKKKKFHKIILGDHIMRLFKKAADNLKILKECVEHIVPENVDNVMW